MHVCTINYLPSDNVHLRNPPKSFEKSIEHGVSSSIF